MLNGVPKKSFSNLKPSLSSTRSSAPSATPADPTLPSDTMQSAAPLDSKEFKMLLDPKRFQHVQAGKQGLWNKLQDAAEETGVEVKKAKKGEVRRQDIIFLDTEDHTLKEQGYILRYRDVSGGSKDDNLTLKYRDHDAANVAAARVDAAPDLRVKSKFELDETFQESETSVYSKSTKVRVPHLPKPTVENLSEIFPTLGELGLDASTKLRKTHGDITEERHLLGNVKIGEHESAPAYLTLWYDEGEKTPAVAEVSFAHKAHEEASGIDQQSEELMRSLHDNAQKWLSHGSTKTNFAYGE